MSKKLPDTTTRIPRHTAAKILRDNTSKLLRDNAAGIPRDSTARIPRALLETATRGAAAATMQFLWPTPPYYEFSDPEAAQAAGECLLTFRDGAKAAGALLDFLPDDALLKFRQANTAAVISIGFSGLLGLQLPQPVAVRRQAIPLGYADQAAFAASDCQPFSIELAEGQTFRGETLGHINALCGVFLFLPEKAGSVIRSFVPTEAIQDCILGKPIGQMLVDRKLASSEEVSAALQRQIGLRTQKLGEYLTENQIVSQEQLATALKQQRAQPVQKLGETLVELGYLERAELEEALAIKSRNRAIPLGQILLDMGIVDTGVINDVMARKFGIPVVDLRSLRIPPEILKKIPAGVAYRYRIVPVAESENALVVAVENPLDMEKMEQLRFIAGSKVIPVMAPKEDIRYALEKNYDPGDIDSVSPREQKREGEAGALPAGRPTDVDVAVEELTSRLASESGELELNEQHAAQSDTTLVKLVNKIIIDAIEQNASDIHIEANPGRKNTRIRFRKDGMLVTYLDMASRFRRAVISRIKIMSQLDITERRKPQDGKIDFSQFGPRKVELRVATIPTSNGLEDVVMRVLAAATAVPIDQLGFDAAALASVKQLISRPYGLFLVCGPTGSGKTTTLHSLLGFLNTPERKIWTAEDPIEIAQSGLRQIQVNAKIGWTFATAMRTILRADPDVVMVGEMRDAETAKIAIEASLTGHLLLATLHTNSAAESVTRLLDLGMDPFNFADALLGVLAQRLIRRLCLECRAAYAPTSTELEELAAEYRGDTSIDAGKLLQTWRKQHSGAGGAITLYRAKGCARCDQTGYKGRLGLFELLVADATVKQLAQTRAPVVEIRAAALANGMRTLKQDGIDKVLQGITDIHQVRTV